MKDNLEKRRYPRLVKSLPIKLRSEDFDMITQTKNISAIGAYCQIDRYIAPMARLNVVLLLPVSERKVIKIQCEGIIARTTEIEQRDKPMYNIAIFFNNIPNKDITKINRYVIKHFQEEANSLR